MTPSRTEQAARNNAIWCDIVCSAHGIPGEFYDSLWLNRRPIPRFYPNVVTLTDQQDAATQIAYIQALATSNLRGGWGIKDSFSSLALADLGFQLLFEASWLWRSPFTITTYLPDTRIRWSLVKTATELVEWETAWSHDAGNGSSRLQPCLFVPSLLADQNIAFIAAYQDEKIVAGAIANRTGDVVGLSNVFTPDSESIQFWVGCIDAVQGHFPGLPLVGYEGGTQLTIAKAAGFEVVQDLRVWTRKA
jgi:hypothetical protein